MYQDVQQLIENCKICKKNTKLPPPEKLVLPIQAMELFKQ